MISMLQRCLFPELDTMHTVTGRHICPRQSRRILLQAEEDDEVEQSNVGGQSTDANPESSDREEL